MKKFYGKPININSFKADWLKRDNLLQMVKRFSNLAAHMRSSPHRIHVTSCYICGETDGKRFGTVYGIGYLLCTRCSHIYADVRFPQEELESYYQSCSEYAKLTYTNATTYYRVNEIAATKVMYISKFVSTGRRNWLDVGSGNGEIVYMANKNGFKTTGLEMAEEMIQLGRETLGIELMPRSIGDVLKERGERSFDVVSYFNTLEHMTDPKFQVEASWKLLAPNGLLVIEAPNAESLSGLADLLFYDQVIRQLYPPFHIMVFTQRSLFYLVENSGFVPEALWYYGLDFYNLLLHFGIRCPGFLESELCQFLLDKNNEFQSVVDKLEKSDQLLLVARKV